MAKKCLNCDKEIPSRNKYCNNQCQRDYEYKQYVIRWKNGEENGLRGKYQTSNYIRRYIFEKYDDKCSICGWGVINPNTNTLPLELEHIDGNHQNNKEENLILLCPNCHSLTATWKGANKGHGRPGLPNY